MTVVLWIVQILLAGAFLAAGGLKLARSRTALIGSGSNMAWAEDFSDTAVKAIGAVEVLGAIGLILPAVTGIATVLVPTAALGLAITMAGAVMVHRRRNETILPPAVLGVLALVFALLRFSAYPL